MAHEVLGREPPASLRLGVLEVVEDDERGLVAQTAEASFEGRDGGLRCGAPFDSGEEGQAAPDDAGGVGRRFTGNPLHEHPEGLGLAHPCPSRPSAARAAVT